MVDQAIILPFDDQYGEDFKRLNVHWIEKYFELEPSDLKVLETPKSSIIEAGGFIFMAEYAGEIVGTCALLNRGDGEFELAKMAVDEKAQGKKIGFLLGEAIVNKARELGAKVIWLETNSMLTPALNLYRKLGFVDAPDRPTPYVRCNVQMEIDFTKENEIK